jgi:alpha-L-fucosidase 2
MGCEDRLALRPPFGGLRVKASRREFIAAGTAIAMLPAAPEAAATPPAGALTLWYEQPTDRWLQALPVGNGRLGAMMFGGVARERLHLSESTLWSGAPSEANVNPDAARELDRIRQLFFAGRYDEADALCAEHLIGNPDQFGTALPMGWLEVALEGAGPVAAYRRWLDLEEGIAGVHYQANGVGFRRELFASNPDGVIALRIECDRDGALNGVIGFGEPRLPGAISVVGTDGLVLRGQALETLHSDGHHGVRFECRLRLVADSGTVEALADGLAIRGARAATLLIAVASDYRGGDPEALCGAALDHASRQTYAALRSTHIADHGALFGRVALELGEPGMAAQLPTDERRRRLAAGADDPGLLALFFQYGRYLTIAGSREDSPLPLALQGIWNDGRAAAMGWADDFHMDVNTQQNYWACEVANLAECHQPVWRYLQMLRERGAGTARGMYGASGWVAHVVCDAWGFTAPGWGKEWGIFVTGGVWLALDLWEHYRFKPDAAFLHDTAYPILRDAAAFFLDYLVVHPFHGWLVTGPSVSPENAFRSPVTGKAVSNSMGPTCDMVLVETLFSACIEAASRLGEDDAFRDRLIAARDRLPPLRISRHGQLQEWLEDFEDAQPNHRHTSQLVALYPYGRIDPRRDPALARAARVTLARRLSQPDWEDTEWSRANLINYYARLLDGDAALRHLKGLIAQDADDALLTFSRGGIAGAEDNIFAIDGNTAGAAGVAEMLLQSHGNELVLLPALPAAWRRGSVRGLRARGDVEVSFAWSARGLSAATFRSGIAATHVVRRGNRMLRIALVEGTALSLTADQLRLLNA